MKYSANIITKESVFKKANEIELFAQFLGISQSDIIKCVNENKKISNPLRIDENPSLSFKYIDGKLYMKDFAGYFQGDLIDLVAKLTGKNEKNPKEFIDILMLIKNKSTSIFNNNTKDNVKKVLNRFSIEYEIRDWNHYDDIYLNKYKVLNTEIMEKERTIPLLFFSTGSCYWSYRPNDPCYMYIKGKGKDGIIDFQLYFPYRKKKSKMPRFITNCSTLFGLFDYTPKPILLLTKSNKDRIICKTLINHFTDNILVLAIPSESYIINNNIVSLFKQDFDKIYTLFDNDMAGKRASIRYKQLGFTPFLLPDKDSGEFCETHSLQEIYQLTEKLIANA